MNELNEILSRDAENFTLLLLFKEIKHPFSIEGIITLENYLQEKLDEAGLTSKEERATEEAEYLKHRTYAAGIFVREIMRQELGGEWKYD